MTPHKCVKCGAPYEDNEPDDYYCAACVLQKKAIAAEVDKKLAGRVKREVKSTFTANDFVGGQGRIMFDANGMRI